MVAKLLRAGGLYLGDDADLMPALADNQDGFWEHTEFVAINDEVLESLGGWWDCPPTMSPGWEVAELSRLGGRVTSLVEGFQDRGPWGWKDPRNSLTLPLWRAALPGLKTVICLRNPLEVALSLKKRNTFSYALSLQLWHRYYGALLQTTTREQRIIVHFDALLSVSARAEVGRLLQFCRLDATEDALSACVAAALPALRHNRLGLQELLDANVADDVVQMYLQLCQEAGWFADVTIPPQVPPADETIPPAIPESATGYGLGAARLDRLAILRAEVASLRERHQLTVSQRQRFEQEIVELRVTISRLEARWEEEDARRSQLSLRDNALREMLLRSQERVIELEDLLANMRLFASATVQQSDYAMLVQRIRRAVCDQLPRDAWIAVVSKGDDAMIEFAGRRATHFPSDSTGGYTGFAPRDSAAAIEQLESLREQGLTHFLVPSTAFWWTEFYKALFHRLDHCHRRLALDPDFIIFDLTAETPPPAREPRRIEAPLSVAASSGD
jgi:hypothetical protein